jgi:hypothetical protein
MIDNTDYAQLTWQEAKKLLDVIANMGEGEALVYLGDSGDHKVVQESELGRVFPYKGFLHVTDRDYGDEAYQLLSEMYQKGAELDLPTDLRERIKAIVEPKR